VQQAHCAYSFMYNYLICIYNNTGEFGNRHSLTEFATLLVADEHYTDCSDLLVWLSW